MMEVLKFIGQDGSHFFGTCLILIIIFTGIVEIVKAIRPKKVKKTKVVNHSEKKID